MTEQDNAPQEEVKDTTEVPNNEEVVDMDEASKDSSANAEEISDEDADDDDDDDIADDESADSETEEVPEKSE